MGDILMTIAVKDAVLNTLGAKEAVAMALESLGGSVRVLQVDVQEPEQMSLARAASETKSPSAASSDGMNYCARCAHYRKQRGQDETGRPYWGVCQLTGDPVYRMSGRCKDWASYI